jgi:hypothetical protein
MKIKVIFPPWVTSCQITLLRMEEKSTVAYANVNPAANADLVIIYSVL